MGTPLPPASSLEDQLTTAQIKKTELETKYLEHPRREFAKYFPLATAFVAVLALAWGSYQSSETNARNESLSRSQRLQAQIHTDKDQLIDFISNKNFSTARVVFLLDDLDSLIEQMRQGHALGQDVSDPDQERQKITGLLHQIVWQVRFDEERHIDFDLQALQRWEPYKTFWVTNSASHHLLISRKYDTAMSKLYLSDPICVRALEYDEKRAVYVSTDKGHKDCENGLFPVLLAGFKARLQIMEADKQTDWVRNEIEVFERLTEDAPIAVKFRQDFEASLRKSN